MSDEWPGQPAAEAQEWPGSPEPQEPPATARVNVGAALGAGLYDGGPERVLHAFGQGYQEGVGPEQFGFSDKSIEALRKGGIFRGEGQSAIWAPFQGFNEGISRPLASALDYTLRASQGLYRGAQAAVAEGIGGKLGSDIASMPDAFAGSPGALHLEPGTVPSPIRPIEGSPAPSSTLRSDAAKTGIPEIDAVLDHPTIKGVIDNAVVDRSHTIPYEAGGSVPIDRPTTYLDQHVPETFTTQRLSDPTQAVTYDPGEPTAIHENVEEFVMERLIKAGWEPQEAYRAAHFGFAEPAEHAWYRFHDIDPAGAEAEWKKLQPGIQHEIASDTPADLYHKEYPGGSVTAARHEDVFEQPATADEIARAREVIRNDPELRGAFEPQLTVNLHVATDLGVIGPERPSISEGSPAEAAKNAVPPMTAYHGSPHSFDAFDTGKIGIGEGAQSYGHGLYFAENPDVARTYQEKLADAETEGNLYQVLIHANKDHMLDWDKPFEEQSQHVQDTLKKFGISSGESGEQIYGRMARKASERKMQMPDKHGPLVIPRGGDVGASEMLHDAGIPGIRYLDQGSRIFSVGDAAEVRIKQIERALQESPSDGSPEGNARIARLQKEIEGLRSPTRNFVVFDHNDVEITHRNGEPVKPPAPPQRPPPEEPPPERSPWRQRFDQFVGKLKTGDDVKALIQNAADEAEEFPQARRGDIPLAQAEALSQATGIEAKDLDLKGIGRELKNDAQVRAAMQVMLKTGDDLHQAMQAVAAKGGVDDLEELAALQAARMRHSLAVEQIAGLRAEWGRTGNVFQEFLESSKEPQALGRFLQDKKGETLDDLRELARHGANLDPRTQLPNFMNSARRPNTFLDKVYWYWVQGLISGVITHMGYGAANYAYAMATHGVATPLAAMIGKVKQLAGVGDDLDRALFGESAAALWAFHTAAPQAIIAAGKSAIAGLRVPLESEMKLRQAAIERGEPVPKALERSIQASETPADRPIAGVAGRILGAPGDAAGGIHSFFKIMGEQASLAATAYRQAIKEGLQPGSQAFFDRMSYLRANPTEEALKGAIDDAYQGTFMKELGPTGRAWSKAVKGGFENGKYVKPVPGLRWIFPFNHIPINILKAGYEWSPAAFFDKEMRADIMGTNGGRAQDMAVAKMVAGSAVMTYFVHKYLSGEATGEYPDDPKERDAWKLAGKEPNSILVGGEWWSMQRFGPPGQLAQMGANLGRVIEGYQGGGDQAMTVATVRIAEAAAHMISDAPGFQSLQNLFEAWGDSNKMTRLAALEAGTFLPFSSMEKQTASFTDPYMRQAKTFLDGVKYSIPGARQTLLPKRAWDGQPIENPGFETIVRARTALTDPVNREMASLGIHPAPPPDRIGGVKLPPDLYDRYQATAGPLTRTALDRMVTQPNWSNMPAYQRSMIMRETITATRKAAAAAMQMSHPELVQAGVQNRISRIMGQPQ